MSIKIIQEGENLLDELISLSLKDENNFLTLEETTFPLLPNPQKALNQFRVFRNTIAQRPSKNLSTTAKLERLNSLINEKEQTNKLIKIDTETFKIREKSDNIIRNIENLKFSLELKIDDNTNEIINNLEEILELLNQINEKINALGSFLERIEQTGNDIKIKINDLYNYLKNNIEKSLINLNNKIEDIILNINDLINKSNRLLSGQDEILTELTSLTGFLTTNIERLLTRQDLIIGEIGAIIALLTGEAIDPRKIKPSLDNFKNKIKEAIQEWFKKTDKEIYQNSSDYICDKIVGESYIKYDASNMYMPTLIFKFKTDGINYKRKYSQLKLRLNYKTNEITDEFINQFKLKIQSISRINYIYGGLKGVYVSEKSLFKTTIFGNDKNEILNLLTNLIPLTNTQFLEQNISYIENSKRNHNLRCKSPLKNIKINNQIDMKPSKMNLSVVYLQVNGLENQIRLY